MKRPSVIPELISSLLACLEVLLPDVSISDNLDRIAEPGDVLSVGVEDPTDEVGSWRSAESSVDWRTSGRQTRTESGTIICCVAAEDATGDPRTARERAFAHLAVVDELCANGWAPTPDGLSVRLMPAMGGPPTPDVDHAVPGLLEASVGHFRLAQHIGDDGAVALLAFDIRYQARI